jgi:hypothetical protein
MTGGSAMLLAVLVVFCKVIKDFFINVVTYSFEYIL